MFADIKVGYNKGLNRQEIIKYLKAWWVKDTSNAENNINISQQPFSNKTAFVGAIATD